MITGRIEKIPKGGGGCTTLYNYKDTKLFTKNSMKFQRKMGMVTLGSPRLNLVYVAGIKKGRGRGKGLSLIPLPLYPPPLPFRWLLRRLPTTSCYCHWIAYYEEIRKSTHWAPTFHGHGWSARNFCFVNLAWWTLVSSFAVFAQQLTTHNAGVPCSSPVL